MRLVRSVQVGSTQRKPPDSPVACYQATTHFIFLLALWSVGDRAGTGRGVSAFPPGGSEDSDLGHAGRRLQRGV